MDPEKALRQCLIKHLEQSFVCFEEVYVRSALFPRHRLRIDVLAIPLDPKFFDLPIAFEVKNVKSNREFHYAEWSPAIKQAADYVYAAIEPGGRTQGFVGRRIVASFVFPAPPFELGHGTELDCDTLHKILTTGAFHAASYFRVGAARLETGKNSKQMVSLSFGPSRVCIEGKGWEGTAGNHLCNKRKLGSQQINVLAELDGTEHRTDLWE
jgi:hypothetical protein